MEATKIIYNEIADEFNVYRVKVWPCVARFLAKFNSNQLLLDIGCGNGKNMIGYNNLQFKGIDFSDKMVEICQSKNLDVIEASMTSIPFEDNMFDGFIAVASYHHLMNDTDRSLALTSMYRVMKPNSMGLIVVWAEEQDMYTYSSKKQQNNQVTKFNFKKEPHKITSKFGFDEMVLWKSKNGKHYERYYHIYSKDDLKNEINSFEPRFTIQDVGWERGNWFVIVKK